MDDGKILRAIAEDLERGFELLVDVYHNLIYRVAYAYFDNREDALDAAQETLYKVYNAVGSFKGGSKLSTWLYRITINQCHDMYRKASIRRTVSYDDPNSDVVPGVSPDLEKLLLDDALAKLPSKLKDVIILREIEGLDYKKISEILKCPVGTVESRLFNARRQLRTLLVEKGAGYE